MITYYIGILVSLAGWIIFLVIPFCILFYLMISGRLGELTGR